MILKEAAYTIIESLVTRFDQQIASYKKAHYNKSLSRLYFADPFFKAPGWDMDNSQGNAEAYREVIHEDKIKMVPPPKLPITFLNWPVANACFLWKPKSPAWL